jgi:hypothetical protein
MSDVVIAASSRNPDRAFDNTWIAGRARNDKA